jgi:hypothetical protein
MNIKLTLTNWGDLDLGSESVIPLNFNLNDIRDISTRGGEFSKTIKLYGTAKNNEILGPIFDVNHNALTLNLQVKEPCILSVDNQVVFEGIFQIRRITKQYDTNGNEFIIYDVYLRSDNSDFYSIINGRFLTDLDMSEFDRIHDKNGILSNMENGNYFDGVQYYLGDTPITEYPVGTQNFLHLYEAQDFRPGIYVKNILDRIFLEAGYTYQFDELYDINLDKLIITTNREKVVPGLLGGVFRAAITEAPGQVPQEGVMNFWRYPNTQYQAGGLAPGTVPASGTFFSPIPEYLQVVWPESLAPNVIFNEDNDGQINTYDTTGQYDNVLGEYILDDNDNVMFFETAFIVNTWIKHNIVWPSSTGLTPNQPIYGAYVRFDSTNDYYFNDGWNWTNGGFTLGLPTGRGFAANRWKNNTGSTVAKERIKVYIAVYDINDNVLGFISQEVIGENEYAMNYGAGSVNDSGIWNKLNIKEFTNEFIASTRGIFIRAQYPTAKKVKVVLSSDFQLSEPQDGFWGFFQGGSGWTNPNDAEFPTNPATFRNDLPKRTVDTEFGFEVFRTNPLGFFKNDVADDLYEGALLSVKNLMPIDFKQSDFLLSLIKMFNLYITVDEIDNKKLIIKTRDKFYDDGLELDWNNKVDIKSMQVDLLSNVQAKNQYLKHATSDDELSKAYKDFVGLEYGELKYVFFNQFISDEKDITTNWSTPVLHWLYKKNIPAIPTRGEHNVFILSVGQVYKEDKYFDYRIQGLGLIQPVLLTEGQNIWRHVGNFYPNSFEPKEDINFGTNEFYAHNYSTITNNNLFNRFYRTQYNIFETGYMMTANFKLNYLDITNIKMNENIWVNNSWWNINRIIDFNVAGNGLTRVELISSEKKIGDFIPNNNLFIRNRLLGNEINSFGRINGGKSNLLTNTSNTETYGKGNKINDTTNTVIIGDFNQVKSSNSLLVGSGMKVDGSGLVILGGSNKSYTGSNKVYVNGLIEQFDLVDAGTDEVLSPFNDVDWVLIDAGTDEVLGLGSSTNIQLIDAGTDEV